MKLRDVFKAIMTFIVWYIAAVSIVAVGNAIYFNMVAPSPGRGAIRIDSTAMTVHEIDSVVIIFPKKFK